MKEKAIMQQALAVFYFQQSTHRAPFSIMEHRNLYKSREEAWAAKALTDTLLLKEGNEKHLKKMQCVFPLSVLT